MNEFIEKNQANSKRMRIVLIIMAVLFFGSYSFIFISPEIAFLPISTFMIALFVCWIIYANKYMQFNRSMKWLQSKGLENVANDIILERPTLPRSKIYCGQQALFSKKPCAIIPYSEIAWVHVFEQRTYGITVQKSIVVYTKDNKKFMLNSNIDEFQWLLENYIVKNSPNVIIGYGPEQKKRYKEICPAVERSAKKVKTVWGIILLVFGGLLLTVGLINQTIEIPGIVILLGAFISGAVLLYLGKKK